jgi:NADPH:quinone reductase-like Zn-dependent oxidoreductase
VPTPAKGEVLIKVEAASVNAIDWQIQEGRFRFLFPSKLPHTPGTDVAGEVVSLGPGVKTLAVGDKVSSWLSFKKVHDSDLNMVTYNTCSSGIDGS